MLKRYLQLAQKTAVLLLVLWTQQAPPAVADSDALEFRHGVSQIPNYKLKYPRGFTHFDYVNVEAPKGGALVLPTSVPLDSVSPLYKPMGYELSYDKLLERSGDEVSGYYCSLAESVAVSADGRMIVFRLHPEARWHDGTPITSTDIKFSIDTFRDDIMAAGWAAMLGWIIRVDAPDERTVVVHTESDAAKQVPFFVNMPMAPAHYWRDRDLTEATMELPLQSGPYRMSEASQGRFFTYTRVTDYWGRELPVNRGRFNFETIRFEKYLDATVAREALRAGIIDLWTETDLRHWLSSYDVPARERGWLLKGTLASGVRRGSGFRLVLNVKRPPFDNVKVREALALAFDFEWQNRALHGGELRRADSYFANSKFASTGLPTEAEVALLEPYRAQLPKEVFDRVFSFHRSEGVGIDREGLSKARQLLADAGYQMRGDVLSDTTGEPLAIAFLTESQSQQRTLLPYVNALTILGIQASIRMIDGTGFAHLRAIGEYDAILLPGFIDMPPTWQLRPYFHSTSTGWNDSGIDNPVVDALVDAALAAPNPGRFMAALRSLDRVLLWNYYQIPLDARVDTRIVYWDKFGRPELPDEMYKAPFPDGWWFDEDKAARIVVDQ